MSNPVEIAKASWGAGLPDWIAALAEECLLSSQNKVAARLGRSAALVSLVLRAKYTGDYEAVEEVFKGVFQAATVDCPALGNLPSHECIEWRKKARRFGNANMLRVQMFRACNKCPRFTGDV